MRHGGSDGTPRVASTGESVRTVPAIVFHGDRDTTVHPRNADHLLTHWIAAGDRDTTNGSVPQATKHQGQVRGGHAYTCLTYRDAGDQVIMERWDIHGLGHAWSGGSFPGSYVDPKGPDASAEMARFFLQHTRQGADGASEPG
ncbi:MAG: hypothetical protein M3N18_12220 [Actinomycetota bacterium]|nr:hypothetical protein [Actinomycetota bacterium]